MNSKRITDEDPWIGYFPIPNNRNKDRLFYEIGKISSPYRFKDLCAIRDLLFELPEEVLWNATFSYTNKGTKSNSDKPRFMIVWVDKNNKPYFRLDNISYKTECKLLFSEYTSVIRFNESCVSEMNVLSLVGRYKTNTDMRDFIKLVYRKLRNE